MRIKHGGLAEAYAGYYEDDMDVIAEYEAWVQDQVRTVGEPIAVKSYESWLEDWCYRECLGHTPLRRLEIYCEWNGLIGYAGTLYELATRGDVV